MSRIKYPETFADEQTLLTNILAKNKELGAKSPLALLFTQQKMDLKTLDSSIGLAAAQNTGSNSLRKESEEDTEARDALLELPWEHHLGEVQFLKHLYAGMERQLGEWGVTVDGKDRVVYAKGAVAEATLVQTFLNHHLKLGAESPLQFYLDEHPEINVEADLAAAGEVIAKNAERNVATGDSELATQQRDKIWGPSVKAIHVIGAFLMGLYHEDDRKMAAWGFVVVADGGKEKEQVSTLEPLESRVQKSVAIPSVFTNAGEGDLHLWRGSKKEGEPMVVNPGGVLGMTKGYSTIVIYNPSSLVMGRYMVMVHT